MVISSPKPYMFIPGSLTVPIFRVTGKRGKKEEAKIMFSMKVAFSILNVS